MPSSRARKGIFRVLADAVLGRLHVFPYNATFVILWVNPPYRSYHASIGVVLMKHRKFNDRE